AASADRAGSSSSRRRRNANSRRKAVNWQASRRASAGRRCLRDKGREVGEASGTGVRCMADILERMGEGRNGKRKKESRSGSERAGARGERMDRDGGGEARAHEQTEQSQGSRRLKQVPEGKF